MNQQTKYRNGKVVSNGIEWANIFGPGSGYTWNPIQGCQHGCRWQMPDGTMAICYAEALANKFKSDKFFPQGFEKHYFHADRLTEPLELTAPAGIFLDSVSDLFGSWVPTEQIEMVFDTCSATPQHIYFSLTKNAPRLLKFNGKFPSNLWVGASVPPSVFMGHPLSEKQQVAMLRRTMDILLGVEASVRWLSVEPLSFDVAPIVLDATVKCVRRPLDWMVIGAASSGPRKYQPDPEWVKRLLAVSDGFGTKVFFKGNLKWSPWREEFPLDKIAVNQAA